MNITLSSNPRRSAPQIGNGRRYQGNNMHIIGNKNEVIGDNNHVVGNNNVILGNNCQVMGNNNTINGDGNDIRGSNNNIQGDNRAPRNIGGPTVESIHIHTGYGAGGNPAQAIGGLLRNLTTGGRDAHRVPAVENYQQGVVIEEVFDEEEEVEEPVPPARAIPNAPPAPEEGDEIQLLNFTGEDESEDTDDRACIICCERKKCVKLNCPHVPLCMQCARTMLQGKRVGDTTCICPICRIPVTRAEKLCL